MAEPARSTAPVGVITRGTTAANRLRRCDRWLLHAHRALVATPGLVVVDLGYGATPVTTLELAERLCDANATAAVVGLEIDPGRVAAAAPYARTGLSFDRGGFELCGRRPHVVRAFNVLRQYAEAEVGAAWATMTARLAPGGIVVDGTCDEPGRLAAWIAVDAAGPRSLTIAVDLRHLERPSAVAARLPKALIHRNVPGERVHALLARLDEAWDRAAPLGVFGPRQRFAAAVTDVAGRGWPVAEGPRRWRLGELTLPWSAVAPGQA